MAITNAYVPSNTFRAFSGTGSPEGAVSAPVGSYYMRTDGAADTSAYVKTNGTGNTGWGAVLFAPDDLGSGGGQPADISLSNVTSTTFLLGNASPEGSVSANVGAIFIRTNGAADSVMYVKTNGSGNTGWGAALYAPDDLGAGGGDAVSVNGTAATDPNFTNAVNLLSVDSIGIDWILSGGATEIAGEFKIDTDDFNVGGVSNTLELDGSVLKTNQLAWYSFTNESGQYYPNSLRADMNRRQAIFFDDFNRDATTKGGVDSSPHGTEYTIDHDVLDRQPGDVGYLTNGFFCHDQPATSNRNIYLKYKLFRKPTHIGVRFRMIDNGGSGLGGVTIACSSSANWSTRMVHLNANREGANLSLTTNGVGGSTWGNYGGVSSGAAMTNGEFAELTMDWLGNDMLMIRYRGTNLLVHQHMIDEAWGEYLYVQLGGGNNTLTWNEIDSIWAGDSEWKAIEYSSDFLITTNDKNAGLYAQDAPPTVHLSGNLTNWNDVGTNEFVTVDGGEAILESSTNYTDTATNDLSGVLVSADEAVLESATNYTDTATNDLSGVLVAADEAVLESATNYTDTATNDLDGVLRTRDEAVLQSATNYTIQATSDLAGVLIAADEAVLESSTNYTDTATNDLDGVLRTAMAITNAYVPSNTFRAFSGTGTPEGAVTAPVGSYYMRTDGAADSSAYVKTNGTGNTGWGAVLMAPDDTGAGGGDAITVNGGAATDPDFTNAVDILSADAIGIDWILDGGNRIAGEMKVDTADFMVAGVSNTIAITNTTGTDGLVRSNQPTMNEAVFVGETVIHDSLYVSNNAEGAVVMGDADGSSDWVLQSAATMTFNTVFVGPTGPTNGVPFFTVSDGTNMNFDFASFGEAAAGQFLAYTNGEVRWTNAPTGGGGGEIAGRDGAATNLTAWGLAHQTNLYNTAATITIDLRTNNAHFVAIDQDVTLDSSERASGRQATLFLTNKHAANPITVTLDSAWKPFPTNSWTFDIPSQRYAVVSLFCWGTTEASVWAQYNNGAQATAGGDGLLTTIGTNGTAVGVANTNVMITHQENLQVNVTTSGGTNYWDLVVTNVQGYAANLSEWDDLGTNSFLTTYVVPYDEAVLESATNYTDSATNALAGSAQSWDEDVLQSSTNYTDTATNDLSGVLETADEAVLQSATNYTDAATNALSGVLQPQIDTKAETNAPTLYGPTFQGTVTWTNFPVSIGMAASDETTAITAGTDKVTIVAPFAFTLTSVRCSLTTAQTSGNIFTVDVHDDGTTVFSTKVTIDNTETSNQNPVTPAVINAPSIADWSEITVDVDQIGDGTATGLKVWLIGYRSL
jgi:hypothetical protein